MDIRSADNSVAGAAPPGTSLKKPRRELLIVIVAVVVVVIIIGGYFALRGNGSGGNGANGNNGTFEVVITGMNVHYTGSSCGFPASQSLNASQIAGFTEITDLVTTASLASTPTLNVQGANCIIESATVTAGSGFTGTVTLFMGGTFPYNYALSQDGVGGVELLIQGTFSSGYNGPLNVAITTN